MKTINSPASKILTVAVSISIVLCSLSLLIFAVGQFMPFAKAETNNQPEERMAAPWDTELRGAAGLGIVKDTAYFVVWSNPNTLYKASIRAAKDWYKL